MTWPWLLNGAAFVLLASMVGVVCFVVPTRAWRVAVLVLGVALVVVLIARAVLGGD